MSSTDILILSEPNLAKNRRKGLTPQVLEVKYVGKEPAVRLLRQSRQQNYKIGIARPAVLGGGYVGLWGKGRAICAGITSVMVQLISREALIYL
jgi:hypothetical protein